MFGNRARYDRLVDGQPTSLSFTEAGDVPCGIEVGVEFEGASLASVDEPGSVALADITASGASLARVSGVDMDDGLALSFGFVLDEPLELAEGPISELPVEAPPESLVSSDPELLQCHGVERLGQYPVGYLVVDIGHEAFFPAREPLELPLGGAGAFGLKSPTGMLVFSFDLSNVTRTHELIIREDGMVDYACIDPEYGVRWSDGRRPLLDHDAEDEYMAIVGELGGDGIPTIVSPEIPRQLDRYPDPALDTRKGHEPPSELGRECPLVVSDGRPSPFERQSPKFHAFQHLGSVVPGGCDDGRGDRWVFFSDGVVCEMVEPELVDDLVLEPRLEDVIGGEVGHLDGPDQAVIWLDMQSDRPLHTENPSVSTIYMRIGGVRESLQSLRALKSGVSLETVL